MDNIDLAITQLLSSTIHLTKIMFSMFGWDYWKTTLYSAVKRNIKDTE